VRMFGDPDETPDWIEDEIEKTQQPAINPLVAIHIAIHEEGHAAAAIVTGVDFAYVTVEPDYGSDGHIFYCPDPQPVSRSRAIVALAGFEAQQLPGFGGEPLEKMKRGCVDDWRSANYWLGKGATVQEVLGVQADCRALIASHADEIKAVAEALQRHRTLTQAEVREVMGLPPEPQPWD
jgi:hypothetical protein